MWLSLFAVIAILPLERFTKRLALLWLNRKKTPQAGGLLGEIISVHADNIYRVRRYKDAKTSLKLFDKVRYRFDQSSKKETGEGFVIGKLISEEEDTFKFIKTSSPDVNEIADRQVCVATEEDDQSSDNITGIVTHGTEISTLRFEYLPQLELSEGDTLYTDTIHGKRIFYQIINAMNLIEAIDNKSENGRVIGYATQIGVYNAETHAFDKYGWVPELNAILYKASPDSLELEHNLEEGEFLIGKMQGLEAPLVINAEDFVTHHSAILGVTGTGKSVFSRQIIKDITSNGFKVICVDFTNEHEQKF